MIPGAAPPHLFQCLTWREFKVVFAIAFTSRCLGYENSYPLERYATPGLEGPSGDWLEIHKRIIRMLYLGYDFVFSGILPLPDGEMNCRLVEERNINFVITFRSGSMPDPLHALEVATEDEQLQGCGLDMEPLREALDDVRTDAREQIAKHHKEAGGIFEVHKEAIKVGREMIDSAIAGRDDFMKRGELVN